METIGFAVSSVVVFFVHAISAAFNDDIESGTCARFSKSSHKISQRMQRQRAEKLKFICINQKICFGLFVSFGVLWTKQKISAQDEWTKKNDLTLKYNFIVVFFLSAVSFFVFNSIDLIQRRQNCLLRDA